MGRLPLVLHQILRDVRVFSDLSGAVILGDFLINAISKASKGRDVAALAKELIEILIQRGEDGLTVQILFADSGHKIMKVERKNGERQNEGVKINLLQVHDSGVAALLQIVFHFFTSKPKYRVFIFICPNQADQSMVLFKRELRRIQGEKKKLEGIQEEEEGDLISETTSVKNARLRVEDLDKMVEELEEEIEAENLLIQEVMAAESVGRTQARKMIHARKFVKMFGARIYMETTDSDFAINADEGAYVAQKLRSGSFGVTGQVYEVKEILEEFSKRFPKFKGLESDEKVKNQASYILLAMLSDEGPFKSGDGMGVGHVGDALLDVLKDGGEDLEVLDPDVVVEALIQE